MRNKQVTKKWEKETRDSQLGESYHSARARLVKAILDSLIVKCGLNFCCRCGGELDMDYYHIDHIKPWLHSDNPIGLFYDLNNVAFSHSKCNMKAKTPKGLCPSRTAYRKGCRCKACCKIESDYYKNYWKCNPVKYANRADKLKLKAMEIKKL